MYTIRKRDDIAVEEFTRYWKNEHANLVSEVAEAIRAKRYVQSHVIDTPINDAVAESRGLLPHYDGLTEVWWDSIEDLQEGVSSVEGAAAMQRLADDESIFIDHAQSTIFLTHEHEVFDR
ncbi:EthD domain-containing protein [Mycolicibacterium goodii]|uniref:EthD domain-containing protein n=1 Tax=Mycolicibacterium goodii TaxID=134601 RepID=UPI0013045EF3|nr:EthD domain-containing protein [Mycolicibacterium goodii]